MPAGRAIGRVLGLGLAAAVLPLAAGLMPSGAALAQQQAAGPVLAPAPQILTLDQERLYAGSLFGKALEAKALAANQALAAENRGIEADLSAEEADLTQRRPKMAAAAFQTLADAFDAKVERLRKEQAAKVEALKTQRDSGRTAFFKAAVPVLADLMRKSGAYAILNHDAVVLSFDAIDVTDRAIAALDASLGDGSGVMGPRLPQAPAEAAPNAGAEPDSGAAPEGGSPAPAPDGGSPAPAPDGATAPEPLPAP